MKTLLYFEEYETDLSKALRKRKDIDVLFIRTDKNIRLFSSEYLEKYKDYYQFIYDNDFDMEITKFKNWLNHKNIKIDYFLNDSEFYMEYSNKIAERLDLECLSAEQVKWVRDKVSMKDKFNQIGLKTVDYQIVTSKNDILEFMKKHLGEPIIFKPRDSMNSKNVFRIDYPTDLDQIDLNLDSGKYMVESYCSDQEWSIESLIQDGKVLDSYVTYIPNRTLWAAMENKLNCHMTVPKIPEYFKFIPRKFIQKIVDGMNLKNGVMTIEVFIDDEGNVMPSELGWRLPGCQATKNHSLSYGFDMINALIDIAIHKKVELKYRDEIISVGDLYLPNKSGLIEKVTPLEELLRYDGVIDGEMFVKAGDYREKRRVGNDASGWVQISGKNEFDTLRKMQAVYESFEIVSSNDMGGRNMLKRIKKYLLTIIAVLLVTTGCSNKLNVINSRDDLNNKNIGVYTGSEYDTIAEKNIENPNILYYNSYSDQISALKSGKIDGFLTDEPLAKEIIKENLELRILNEKLTEDSYAFAISPTKKILQDEINKELVKMNKDGILKIFEDKWMGNDESQKELEVYHYDDSKGVVKFATVSGSAPFAYMKNNKIVGYDIDVISYICKELGYKLEVIEMSFDGIIPALKSGKVDIAGCSIIVTEERKKSVLFSDPDYTGGIVVVVRGTDEKQN